MEITTRVKGLHVEAEYGVRGGVHVTMHVNRKLAKENADEHLRDDRWPGG